jgi:RHS repeat-associated protein
LALVAHQIRIVFNQAAMYYSAFGAPLAGRTSNSPGYKYGFNGAEKDDEYSGNGNTYSFEYRVHDARLGRFLSQDPLMREFPWNSPYAFAENMPIIGPDLEGLEQPNNPNATNQKENTPQSGPLNIGDKVDVDGQVLPTNTLVTNVVPIPDQVTKQLDVVVNALSNGQGGFIGNPNYESPMGSGNPEAQVMNMTSYNLSGTNTPQISFAYTDGIDDEIIISEQSITLSGEATFQGYRVQNLSTGRQELYSTEQMLALGFKSSSSSSEASAEASFTSGQSTTNSAGQSFTVVGAVYLASLVIEYQVTYIHNDLNYLSPSPTMPFGAPAVTATKSIYTHKVVTNQAQILTTGAL